MGMINIGRVQHSSSGTIRREVRLYASGTSNISNETASAIAASFQTPAARDEPFVLLGQGSPVDQDELRHAVRREIDSNSYDDEAESRLWALLQWTIDQK
jgi:hypothetical protein